MAIILINEKFDTEPSDWVEIGEISTYDAVNKDVDISTNADTTYTRYSKNHDTLTIDNSFYFEKKILVKSSSDSGAKCLAGIFNQNETTNLQNMIGIIIRAYQSPLFEIEGYYSDGVRFYGSLSWAGTMDTEYLIKFAYNGSSRIAILKIYSGTGFTTLEATQTLTLSSTKSFTVNTFGVGNKNDGINPTLNIQIDYDEVYMTVDSTTLTIRNKIYDTLNALTDGSDEEFYKFKIYKDMPQNEALVTPCIVITLNPSPATEYMFGKDSITYLSFALDLAFKRGHEKTVSATLYNEEDLAAWYLDNLTHVLEDIDWGSINLSERLQCTGRTHKEFNEELQTYLYGCSVNVIIPYKTQ